MADPETTPAAVSAVDTASNRVTLRLLSPSSDLVDFPLLVDLPTSTTIREVRTRVEAELAARRRSTAGMRLIFHGHLLDKDDHTLADVLGSGAMQESSTYTIHLVVRETITPARRSTQPATTTSPVPAAAVAPTTTTSPFPTAATATPMQRHTGQTHAGVLYLPPHQPLAQNPLPERPMQQHPGPGQFVQPLAAAAATATAADPTVGQASGRELSPAEVKAILAEVDTAGQGSPPSGSSVTSMLLQRHKVPPSSAQSSEATTAATSTSASRGAAATVRQGPDDPNVYVLNSPTGPRALLINENSVYFTPSARTPERLTTYLATSLTSVGTPEKAAQHVPPTQQQQHPQAIYRQHLQKLQALQRVHRQHVQHILHLHALQQQRDAAAGMMPRRPIARPMNMLRPAAFRPPHAGIGFMAAMWRHAWLVARLILFVWWFTTPTATWWRWTMVLFVATAVFFINTGLLDGLVVRIFLPMRRHIDGLLPGAVPPESPRRNAVRDAGLADARAGATEAIATVPVGQAGAPEPDPAETAARLVAARRDANGERLMGFARWLERVGIMLLASLAPGVAERHVAMIEEAARTERQRQEAEAEAARAAAAAEADTQTANGEAEAVAGVADTETEPEVMGQAVPQPEAVTVL